MKTDLTKIPGIGINMAEHLIRAGFPTIESLLGKSPDEIYAADCAAQGMPVTGQAGIQRKKHREKVDGIYL